MQGDKVVAAPSEIDLVFSQIPQQPPFRFIDKILELSTKHCIGEYTFRRDEFFYSGHFPHKPITPGVILLEAMAQTGVVALGIFLAMKTLKSKENLITLFTDANVEFNNMVLPEEKIKIQGELEFFRKNKIRSKVEVLKEDGKLVAYGILSGMGVVINE